MQQNEVLNELGVCSASDAGKERLDVGEQSSGELDVRQAYSQLFVLGVVMDQKADINHCQFWNQDWKVDTWQVKTVMKITLYITFDVASSLVTCVMANV